MKRLQSSLLAGFLAVAAIAQDGNPMLNPRVRAIGQQLECQCGCGSSVTECNMLHCHFCDPARAKLLKMVSAGESDPAILNAFVKDYGLRVLLKPPSDGFNLVGWVMPFAAIVAGLAFLWWMMQRFRRPLAVAVGPDSAALARYQERIEEDLETLD